MNKLYNAEGKLIGYTSGEINTSNKLQLFNSECEILDLKFNALEISEADRCKYHDAGIKKLFDIVCSEIDKKLKASGISEDNWGKFYAPVVSRYRLQGINIRNGTCCFTGTTTEWEYKPIYCENMFTWCRCEASTIDVSSLDTSNATNMSCMFYESDLKSIDISSFDTHNVTDMSKMFASCSAQIIDISSFNMSKVKNMYEMFYGCKASCIKINQQAFNKIYNCKEAFDKKTMTRDIFKTVCEIV